MSNQRAMDELGTRRQLAAVVFLDMVGYSVLMHQSEARAQAAVERLWSFARPLIAEHGGEEIRTFGDGMLVIFPATAAAALCCIELFHRLARHNGAVTENERLQARVGLHLGEIGRSDDEIFGDGVNIAARLMGLAPPGAIALSPHVREQLANMLEVPLKSLGPRRLKNIGQPLEVFCLPGPECSPQDLDVATAGEDASSWCWRFGLASYNESARELQVSGRTVTLDQRSHAVLHCLLKFAGEVVSRVELREAAGTLSDNSLSHIIERLRKALRDSSQSQIKTHAGVGYRLAVPVSVEATPETPLTQFDFRAGDHPPLRPWWSLVEMLGRGGQGEVWRVRHDKTGEQRVYKFAVDAAGLGALKREITLSRVLHSIPDSGHFVSVLDWNLERPPYFIECQHGGESLIDWAEQQGGIGTVPIETRVELIAEIAEALAGAHSVGVLHKDLKPANVLIQHTAGEPPSVRLADFGSGGVLDTGRLDQAGITPMGFTRTPRTGEEHTTGTPAYLAPERMAGQPATVQADIYALGIMLYQVVVGDLGRIMATGWEQEVADELLRADIAAATQGDPRRRLADAGGFAKRLRRLAERRQEWQQQRAEEEHARRAKQEAAEARARLDRMHSLQRWSLAVTATLFIGLAATVYQQQRAVAAETRALAAAREAEAVASFLSEDLFAVMGQKPLAELTVEELLREAGKKLEQRGEQLPRVAAQLHAALGQAFWNMERLGAAEAQLQRALSKFERAGGLASPAALQVAARLLLIETGQLSALPAKLPRYQAILQAGREALGAEHTAVLALSQQLAFVRFHVGHWQEAAREYAALLAALPAGGSKTSMGFGTAQAHYGNVLVHLGQFAEATQWLSNAAADTQATPLDRAAAEYFLAFALIEQERFAAAETALQRAQALLDQWAVAEASMTRLSLELMRGRLRLRQGRPEAAIDILAPAVGAVAKLHSAKGADFSGEHRAWLARAYQAAGEPDRAVQAMREAIENFDGNFGSRHPLSQAMRIDLAGMLLAAGEAAAAHDTLAGLDQVTLDALGPAHPFHARRLRVQGLLAAQAGQAAPARQHLAQALQIAEHCYGAEHSFSREIQAHLAPLAQN